MINAKTQEGRSKKFKAYIDVEPVTRSKKQEGHRDVVGDFYAPGKGDKNDFQSRSGFVQIARELQEKHRALKSSLPEPDYTLPIVQ